jgi:hypothetical protein
VAEVWIEAAKINVKSSRCRSCCCPTADRIPLSPCCVRDSTMSFSVPRPINVYLCSSFLHQCLIRHEAVTMHSSTAKSLEIYSELTPLRSSSWHLPQIGRGAGTWRRPSRARARAKRVEGPFCDCKGRGYCDWGSWWEGGGVLVEKRRFKSKALDLLCSVCTGSVLKPEAWAFIPTRSDF